MTMKSKKTVLIFGAIALLLICGALAYFVGTAENITGTITIHSAFERFCSLPLETTEMCQDCGHQTEHIFAGTSSYEKCIGYYQCKECKDFITIAYSKDTISHGSLNGYPEKMALTCSFCKEETEHCFTGVFDKDHNANYQCCECKKIQMVNFGATDTGIPSEDYSPFPIHESLSCDYCEKETVHYFTGGYERQIGNYQCSECLNTRSFAVGRG